MRLQRISRAWFGLFVAVVVGLMVACTCVPPQVTQVTKPTVVIVTPTDGAEYTVGQLITVQAIATDSQGVTRVEMAVGGGLVDTVSNPSPQPSFNATLSWTPNTTGVHALTVVAYNASGVASDPALVRVNVSESGGPGPGGDVPVIQSFTASPPAIDAGDSSTLSWEVTGATSVEIDQGVGSVGLSGSQSVSPASTTTYVLTAYGDGGDATASATVTVNPAGAGTPPVINVFSADPPTIDAGNSSTLSWEVTGATSVEIDHGVGSVSLSGNRNVSPASTTTYRLTASNADGEVSATAQVTVNPAAPPPTCVPSLASPANGATLDNGRTDHTDDIIWDFDWSDCAGATQYHLYVIRTGSANPTIDKNDIGSSSYHHVAGGSYISNSNLTGWTWKVRARVSGTWGDWSPTRSFNVEPPDTDGGSGTINATITAHSYDASSGWMTFRVQNTGSLPLESARCQIVNRDTNANYYGPGTSNSPFRDSATSDVLVSSVAAGATKYMRYKLTGNPTGVPCRATITLYSQDNSGGSNVTKTVDFSLAGSSGTINATITAHSYDSSTGMMTFRVQNTGSLPLESAKCQIINRNTNAVYYGGASGFTSNTPFRDTATSNTLVSSVAPGATKYMRYVLAGSPTGVPCRATITLYSQDNSGGSSVAKTVDFSLAGSSGGAINATVTAHSYDASTGWMTFRIVNSGATLESVGGHIINRTTNANYYGPAYSDSPFRTSATQTAAGESSMAAGQTRYLRFKLTGNPTGVPCRATITLYTGNGQTGTSAVKTVDFSLAGSSSGINATISYYSYDDATGMVTFRIVNTGGVAIECAQTQVINRSTNANYYGPAYSNSIFRSTPTGALGPNVPTGSTKYMAYYLSGRPPNGTPCRATITIYSQDGKSGTSVVKTIDFTLN